MKLSIAQRFALVLAAAGILAAGLTGYYAYHASRELLLRAAEDRLLTSTRVLMRQVVLALQKGGQDVLLLAGHPRTLAALTMAASPERAAAEDDVAALFVAMLKTRPDIYQLRLITTSRTRDGARPRRSRRSTVWYGSAATNSRRRATIPTSSRPCPCRPARCTFPGRSSTTSAADTLAKTNRPCILRRPFGAADGTTIGLIVLNADLNWVFRLLASDLPEGIGLYLTNGHGDFLLHPDASQAFAFDRGKRILVQDQFPDTTRLFDGQSRPCRHHRKLRRRSVAAFIRQQLEPAPGR